MHKKNQYSFDKLLNSNRMLLLYLIIYLRTSFALLLTTENRISTRNITCLHGLPLTTINFSINCEACLITSRNYLVETTLSLTGNGPEGFSYTCLRVNDIEIYHENLVRECRYFPRYSLNGSDDFCIASPYNFVRGSYRACICITDRCNHNYSYCAQQINPIRDLILPEFSNTITALTDRVKCYQPYDDYNQQTYTNLTQLCSKYDYVCQNFLHDNGVLCVISLDRTNRIFRQTLIPSIYSASIIKYKTQLCNTFVTTSKSISFSGCESEETVCMCAMDECNKDLGTCRASRGNYKKIYLVYLVLFVLVLEFYSCMK